MRRFWVSVSIGGGANEIGPVGEMGECIEAATECECIDPFGESPYTDSETSSLQIEIREGPVFGGGLWFLAARSTFRVESIGPGGRGVGVRRERLWGKGREKAKGWVGGWEGILVIMQGSSLGRGRGFWEVCLYDGEIFEVRRT